MQGHSHTTRTTQAFRRFDTVRPRQVGGIELKGGNLFLDALEFPEEVAPGGTVRIEATVANGALWVDLTDQDRCSAGARTGYKYRFDVEPQWAVPTESVAQNENATVFPPPTDPGETVTGTTYITRGCVTTTEIGVRQTDVTLEIPAPQEPGDYNFAAELATRGSNESGSITQTITVREGADETPVPDPAPGGDNGGGGDDQSGQTLGIAFAAGAGLALLALLLVATQ